MRSEKLVQLKDFSLITPTLEAELIFKAIETVISPSVIRQTLSETGSCEERPLEIAIWVGSVSSHSNESMVIGSNGGRTEKSGEWIK